MVYDTREFAEQARLFAGERLVLGHVEPAADGDGCFLLGYERPEVINSIGDNFYFVARLSPQGGLKRRALSAERYFELCRLKAWELSGFTAKKAQRTFVPPERRLSPSRRPCRWRKFLRRRAVIDAACLRQGRCGGRVRRCLALRGKGRCGEARPGLKAAMCG